MAPAAQIQHLPIEIIARLIEGTLSAEDQQRHVLPHLLDCCPHCRPTHDTVRRRMKQAQHWQTEVALVELPEAPQLWSRLEGLSLDEQLCTAIQDPDFHTWALVRLLQANSLDAARDALPLAPHLAKLALAISHRLPSAYDPDWVSDLSATCHANWANACRMLRQPARARRLFSAAWLAFDRSFGQMVETWAYIADLEAALLLDLGRLAEAHARLDRVHRIWTGAEDPEADDPHLRGQTLAHRAFCLERSGRLKQAVSMLANAAATLDSERDPRLHFAVLLRSIQLCIQLERTDRAQALLPCAHRLAQSHGTGRDRLRLRHAEARLAAALHDLDGAKKAYSEARDGLLDQGAALDAALVLLDLAAFYAGHAPTDCTATLASQLLPIVNSPQIEPPALELLLELRRACDERRLTPALAARLRDSLERQRPCEW